VFTRVVNHCVIVGDALGDLSAPKGNDGGIVARFVSLLLMSELRCRLAKKPVPCSMLGRFANEPFRPPARVGVRFCWPRVAETTRFVPKRFWGPPLRRADL